jgi:hypothetical protein
LAFAILVPLLKYMEVKFELKAELMRARKLS